MDALKDLELLIQSRYPLVAVETYEEDRLQQVLEKVAGNLGVSLYIWTLTGGLRRAGAENGIYDTDQPLKALGNLEAIKYDGIFYFKDLHRSLGEAQVVRRLQDLARHFVKGRRAILLSAAHVTLPAELEKLTARFRLDLPGVEELRRLAKDVVRDLSRQHTIRMDLSAEDFDRLAERMRGFTLFEAERALMRAVLHDLALTPGDLDLIVEIKKELLAPRTASWSSRRPWRRPGLHAGCADGGVSRERGLTCDAHADSLRACQG